MNGRRTRMLKRHAASMERDERGRFLPRKAYIVIDESGDLSSGEKKGSPRHFAMGATVTDSLSRQSRISEDFKEQIDLPPENELKADKLTSIQKIRMARIVGKDDSRKAAYVVDKRSPPKQWGKIKKNRGSLQTAMLEYALTDLMGSSGCSRFEVIVDKSDSYGSHKSHEDSENVKAAIRNAAKAAKKTAEGDCYRSTDKTYGAAIQTNDIVPHSVSDSTKKHRLADRVLKSILRRKLKLETHELGEGTELNYLEYMKKKRSG